MQDLWVFLITRFEMIYGYDLLVFLRKTNVFLVFGPKSLVFLVFSLCFARFWGSPLGGALWCMVLDAGDVRVAEVEHQVLEQREVREAANQLLDNI